MVIPRFLGPTNVQDSVISDCERTINWMPQVIDAGTPKARPILVPTPGTRLLSTGVGQTLGTFQQNGRMFIAQQNTLTAGGTFYEESIDAIGNVTLTNRGTIVADTTPVTFCSQGPAGNQLLFVSAKTGYSFDLLTNALTTLTGTPKAVTSLTSVGTTATATVTAHGFVDQTIVDIQGANQPEYNGEYQITVVDANTFTYAFAGSGTSPATGTITATSNATLGTPESVSSLTSVGTVATAVVTNHGYVNNAEVVIAGASQTEYNGTYFITLVDDNTFFYTFAGSLTSPATGTITSTLVTDGFPFNPLMCGFTDGYGVLLQYNTNKFFLSNLEDFTVWDPLNVAQNSETGDIWISLLIVHRELWLFGGKTTQVWVNTGDVFPFAPIPALLIEQGCAATWGPTRIDNTIFWPGQDERGKGIVYRANQYTPQRVSTYAIERVLQSQAVTLSTATGWSYQEAGHVFYVLDVQGAETTPVFDVGEQQWHERAEWDPVTGLYARWNYIFAAAAFGQIIVGNIGTADGTAGNISTLSRTYPTEQVSLEVALLFGTNDDNSQAVRFLNQTLNTLATSETVNVGASWGCFDIDGSVWLGTYSGVVHMNPTTAAVIANVTTAVNIGQTVTTSTNGFALRIDPSTGDLITRNKSTGHVIRLNSSTGAVKHTFGLTVTVLDCSVSSDGTTLYYANGATISCWDLINDVALPDFFTAPDNVFWPTVLVDNTVVFAFGAGYAQDNRVWHVGRIAQVTLPIETAIIAETIGSGLTRDGSFLDLSKDWTKIQWCLVGQPVSGSDYVVVRKLGDTVPDYTPPYLYIGSETGSLDVYGGIDPGSGFVDTDVSALSENVWVSVATRYQASTKHLEQVINGVQSVASVSVDLSAVTPQAGEYLLTDTEGALGLVACAYARDWQAYLSDAALQLEMASPIAIRITNLLADTPLESPTDLSDLSGNGNGWTAIGNLATITGPSISAEIQGNISVLQEYVTPTALLRANSGFVGMLGIAADASQNKLWAGYCKAIGGGSDLDYPVAVSFNLTTGVILQQQTYSETTDYGLGTNPMAAPITPVTVTTAPPAPGPPQWPNPPGGPGETVGLGPPNGPPPLASSVIPPGFRAIGRLRVGPHLNQERMYMVLNRFELDLEVGIGPDVRQAPQMWYGQSKDGGQSWSAWRGVSGGVAGQFNQRVLWRVLGRARDRVPRISTMDPIAWTIVAAYGQLQPGIS